MRLAALAPCPLAGSACQGCQPNHPGPSGFSHRRQCRPRSFRASAFGASGSLAQPGLPKRLLEAETATPANALSSRSFGRPRNLPQTGQSQYRARLEGVDNETSIIVRNLLSALDLRRRFFRWEGDNEKGLRCFLTSCTAASLLFPPVQLQAGPIVVDGADFHVDQAEG